GVVARAAREKQPVLRVLPFACAHRRTGALRWARLLARRVRSPGRGPYLRPALPRQVVDVQVAQTDGQGLGGKLGINVAAAGRGGAARRRGMPTSSEHVERVPGNRGAVTAPRGRAPAAVDEVPVLGLARHQEGKACLLCCP
ncbi:unnamed protein product, partial [Ectocarpus sp. 8 AP-2014]